MAAFIWATYYLFIHYGASLNDLLIFSVPSISGSLFLGIPEIKRTHSISFIFSRRALLSGGLYFISQFLIIVSAERNGSIMTALSVLIADSVVTPVASIALKLNRSKINYPYFAMAMVLVIPSSTLLTIYGKNIGVSGSDGLIMVAGIILSLPAFFILLNSHISEEGLSKGVSGAFFWPGLIGVIVGTFIFQGQFQSNWEIPIISLLLAGITSMGLAYFLFFWAVQKNGFALPGLLQSMIPIFTALLVFVFEKEPLSLFSVILMLTTSSGAAVALFSIRPKEEFKDIETRPVSSFK